MIFNRKKSIFLLLSLILIALGFIIMKLEDEPHGLGPLALNTAPILILIGYFFGFISVFRGRVSLKIGKAQLPVIIAGWAVFCIALTVYVITLEETASLWDCAEFIACAYKLQVPHAPGAPLFLMIGRVFSMIALDNTMKVAFWINMSSAISSSFAVMFTFWSVVMLGKRVQPKAPAFTLITCGSIAAFTIAFSDSFWYSAVEAEIYAMATLTITIIFWGILKWDKDQQDVWLIFIMYTLGLSVGVHPMSLLIVPAATLVIVFRLHGFSLKNLFLGTIAGATAILILNHAVLFGLPDLMKYADIFFVNVFSLPFYSGAISALAVILVFGFLFYRRSLKKRRRFAALFITGMTYFLIGYSSYFMIIIRSQADTPIDENNPDNIISLTSYLKRESYGSRPLIFGPDFTSNIEGYQQGSPIYGPVGDSYEIIDHKTEYKYEKGEEVLLPRMYSRESKHIGTYLDWSGLKEGQKPKFTDHLAFMFNYQFGHSYLRYLMFNFSGRESDVQHAGWLGVFDVFRKVPDGIMENPARNNFLMLPLLLGIFGMIYQYKTDKAGFWTLTAFFLFYGFILVFYLNAPPDEPRERDYIYVGSYLAFAVWCGLGAMGLGKYCLSKYPIMRYATAIFFFIPILLLTVGFDDHDRSDRTLQIDYARNTLSSCPPNAILFTGGDNDTFPLWYVQEVEEFRTDVRIIVLSYFNADWYIDQMKKSVYASEALPISLEKKHYRQGGLNDLLPIIQNPDIKGAINLERLIYLIRNENKALQVKMTSNVTYNSVPSKAVYLDVDAEIVNSSPEFPKKYADSIPKRFEINLKGKYLEKSALMVLDIISTNQWQRPICFNLTSLNMISLELKKSVLTEGLVFRLYPFRLEKAGEVNIEKMYTNLTEKAIWQDLNNEHVYYNHEDYQLRILQNMKSAYNDLALALIRDGQAEEATKVAKFIKTKLYGLNKETDISSLQTLELFFVLGEEESAADLAQKIYQKAKSILAFSDKQKPESLSIQIQFYTLQTMREIASKHGHKDLADKCNETLKYYL